MPKKLLLAEDSVTMQKVFELALAQSGVSVVAVDNGHDAIRLVEEIGPDLVVADVTLPSVDGYGVALAIRETEIGKDLPVLILSGTMVALDEERMKACGAKGVLFKPFESRELLERVESLLGQPAPAIEAPVAAAEPPADDAHWDFSDVLDEVDGVVPAARAEAPEGRGDDVFPGGLAAGAPKDEPVALNEYDVSIDEIDAPTPLAAPREPEPLPAPEAPPEPEPESPVRAAHIEGSILEDAPSAVTDLSPPADADEEIEELHDIQELPEAPAIDEAQAVHEFREIHEIQEIEEVAAAPATAAEPVPAPAEATAAPQSEEVAALHAVLKEQFAARADEIFRAVATEAVERAVWEMMDRLAAEFSEKLRESVEAVAWEVIPATAETLIRDEIARIRTQAGKSST